MRAALPWLSHFLGVCAYFNAFDAGKKQARQTRLAGMAFSVHRAEIEELIAKSVALLLLREDVLQREGEFAQACGFGPVATFVFNQRDIREEAAAAMRAFF